MFVYGVCVGRSRKYERFALPSLKTHAPRSPVAERRDQLSIFPAYNSLLDWAGAFNQLEALVLLHDDVELREPIETKLRAEFADPDVAIVGVVGGRGVRSVRWSRAQDKFGQAADTAGVSDLGGGAHDVDIVDGLLLALSPWAVSNLRFDEATFFGFHAYDADICMQARARGKRVRVTELDVFHHTKGGFGDVVQHRRADDDFRDKWHIPRDSWAFRFRRRRQGMPY